MARMGGRPQRQEGGGGDWHGSWDQWRQERHGSELGNGAPDGHLHSGAMPQPNTGMISSQPDAPQGGSPTTGSAPASGTQTPGPYSPIAAPQTGLYKSAAPASFSSYSSPGGGDAPGPGGPGGIPGDSPMAQFDANLRNYNTFQADLRKAIPVDPVRAMLLGSPQSGAEGGAIEGGDGEGDGVIADGSEKQQRGTDTGGLVKRLLDYGKQKWGLAKKAWGDANKQWDKDLDSQMGAPQSNEGAPEADMPQDPDRGLAVHADEGGVIPDDQQVGDTGNVGEAPVTYGRPQTPDADNENYQDQENGVIAPQTGVSPRERAGNSPQIDPEQAIKGMLSGRDAMPPEKFQALQKQVDPEGRMDPVSRTMAALGKATTQGGDEAGWSYMQHAQVRMEQTNKMAAAVLPHDPEAAIQAANAAQGMSMDGWVTQFQPTHGGVIATGTNIGSGEQTSQRLTFDQFEKYLMSPASFFAQHELGTPELFKRVASDNTPVGRAAAEQGGQDKSVQDVGQLHNLDKRDAKTIEDRAWRMFPTVGQTRKREAWIQQQMDAAAGTQQKVYGSSWHLPAAEARAGGQVGAAHEHALGQVYSQMFRSQSYDERTRSQFHSAMAKVAQQAQQSQDKAEGPRIAAAARLADRIAAGIPLGASAEEQIKSFAKAGVPIDELLSTLMPGARAPTSVPTQAPGRVDPTTNAPQGATAHNPQTGQYLNDKGEVWDGTKWVPYQPQR